MKCLQVFSDFSFPLCFLYLFNFAIPGWEVELCWCFNFTGRCDDRIFSDTDEECLLMNGFRFLVFLLGEQGWLFRFFISKKIITIPINLLQYSPTSNISLKIDTSSTFPHSAQYHCLNSQSSTFYSFLLNYLAESLSTENYDRGHEPSSSYTFRTKQ